MDAVPSLCATGTVGIAVVGYAFGLAQLTPSTVDRRRSWDGEYGDRLSLETRPSELPTQAGAAAIPRMLQPGALPRPQSASIPRRGTRLPHSSTPDDIVDVAEEWSMSMSGNDRNAVPNEAGSEPLGTWAGSAKSSWLRRMSTIAASQPVTPTSTHRPSTASVSFSNGSRAPFIGPTSSPAAPPNKLVKRPSSQRAHFSTVPQSPFIPTLRRPATSHQRSADIQQRSHQGARLTPPDPTFPEQIARPRHRPDEHPPLLDGWQPFFRTRTVRMAAETPLKPGGGLGRAGGRGDRIRTVAPGTGEMPTLLMATAITKAADGVAPVPRTPPSAAPTPPRATAHALSSPGTIDPGGEREATPRRSFSIGDFFASPTPSGWKVPRSTSLRRRKGGDGASVGGRRITSEPQAMLTRKYPGNARRRSADRLGHETAEASDPHHHHRPTTSTMRSPSSPLPPLNRLSALDVELFESSSYFPTSPIADGASTPPVPPNPLVVLPSNAVGPTMRSRSHRPSGAPSDRASTAFSSDNENSQIFTADGHEVDCRSDTVYDSVRTGATGSIHSGIRGPKLEHVFDASPASDLVKQNLAALQEKLSDVSLSRPAASDEPVVEEEDSAQTPLGIARSVRDEVTTPSRHADAVCAPDFPSSPPSISGRLARGDEPDAAPPEEDWTGDGPWDRDGEASDDMLPALSPSQRPSLDLSRRRPERPKSNIFEWSERHGVDKDLKEGSAPRPKTVHGKQTTERSRACGRRGPSALHLRSQSVPLPPDAINHRGFNNASKLDSWMLGGKGVSEDWDGDFEFDEHGPGQAKAGEHDPTGVVVPRSIMERQASVHGQFGQVKELTLLVEELKRLHHLATVYELLHGRASELWKEAEGIINLATLDDEDEDFFPPRSPNSATLDYDPFEEDSPATSRRQRSNPSTATDGQASRPEANASTHLAHSSPGSKFGTPPPGRPRKESVAQAKSVLEHMQHHRVLSDASAVENNPAPKKMPFDTTSLRDLVTRAGVVTRALKEIVRKVENVDNSPHTPERQIDPPRDPPFSQIFYQPSSPPQNRSPSLANRSPRVAKSSSNNSFLGGSMTGNDNDVMKMMTVV